MPRFRSGGKDKQKDSQWDLHDPGRGIEVVHKESDSGWSEWHEASQLQENRFAQTVPGPETIPMPHEERAWDDTQPAGEGMKPAKELPAAPTPRVRETTLEDVLRYVRANQRLCPRPAAWDRFSALLPPLKTKRGSQPAPRPITGRAWEASPARAKRACFLEQVEWASRTGVLKQALEFLQALPEEEWLHAGEQ
jgi:hypothetical protein